MVDYFRENAFIWSLLVVIALFALFPKRWGQWLHELLFIGVGFAVAVCAIVSMEIIRALPGKLGRPVMAALRATDVTIRFFAKFARFGAGICVGIGYVARYLFVALLIAQMLLFLIYQVFLLVAHALAAA